MSIIGDKGYSELNLRPKFLHADCKRLSGTGVFWFVCDRCSYKKWKWCVCDVGGRFFK